jgi:hypothetical protein
LGRKKGRGGYPSSLHFIRKWNLYPSKSLSIIDNMDIYISKIPPSIKMKNISPLFFPPKPLSIIENIDNSY